MLNLNMPISKTKGATTQRENSHRPAHKSATTSDGKMRILAHDAWVDAGSGGGGSEAKIVYRLRAGDEGKDSTLFEYENAFDPPGGFAGRAATRFVNAAAGQREARKSMQRLRSLFEG